ncbi:DUF2914 domain-containing protein [Nitrosomonas marina]|uniref:DUF2914 domain-containing protein n=1 Tax=Nitrosomonas marina TaxID=917 RepID=A0A1H8B7A9_9PROT|nr:DUF2914 domain-containing protein [Nitrosomonas marina]SEM78044.1 Protein of unknown function [Nitrosomonas marina]
MSDNKLKIRIHIQQPNASQQSDEIESFEAAAPDFDAQSILDKPPLDWNKIALAAVLFMIVIAVIGYLAYLIFKQDITDTQPVNADSEAVHFSDSSALYNNFSSNTADTSPENLSDTPVLENTAANEETKTNKKDLPDQLSPADDSALTESGTDLTIIPGSKPGHDKKTASLRPSPKPDYALTDQQQPPMPHDSGTPVSATSPDTIDHDQIIRAQLTRAVNKREPVDEIDKIQLEQNIPRNIYFFVELHDLAGQQVTVNWYFNEQHMAETTLEVNGRNWRTYANKLLNKKSIGTWRVTLTDEAGEQLVERHFIVSNSM